MNRFLLLTIILMTSFSCKEKDVAFIENENPVEIIRNTVCYHMPPDTLICKNEICDTGMCLFYQNVWKEILLDMNDLDNEYFENHITICKTVIDEWQDGYSFTVYFWLTHGWAKMNFLHSFIVKIHSGNPSYPDVYLRRGVYLSKQEIIKAIYFDAFNSKMEKISNLELLKYKSMLDALDQLTDSAKVDTLCYRGICIDRVTGNLNLEAEGQYVDEYNACVFGYIDLFTGETRVEDGPCFYEGP